MHKVSLPSNVLLKNQGHTTMKNGPEFCIDASKFGNVSRFINHGCEPNLFVQCVLSSYHDIRLARVVLFAACDIHPNLVRILLLCIMLSIFFFENSLSSLGTFN